MNMNMGMGIKFGSIALVVYAITMTTLYLSKHSSTKSMLNRLDQPDTLSIISKVEDLERKLKSSESTRQRAEHTARTNRNAQVNNLERENKLLMEERNTLKNVHMPEANEKLEKHSLREQAFMDQVGWLMDATRRESKRMVLERYVT